MASQTDLRIFSLQFFKELGATIRDTDKYLEITNVPQKFQKFYGKNEPYHIVFDKFLAASGTELVTSESYLLKMMRAYLDNTGDSVILRLQYPLQVDSLIRSNLSLRNCTISKATATLVQRYLFKFTFQTTYRYLNEEERLVTDVFVSDGEIVNPDLSLFKISEMGNKEIEIPELREYYNTAKNSIRENISPKTNIIAAQLEGSLSQEISRINAHSEQQVKEIDEQLTRAKARESSDRAVKIRQVDLTALEKQKLQFIQERDFFIQNEQKKHALSLNIKLLTTTIMLYPAYSLEVFFRSDAATRLVILSFDPLSQKIVLPLCDFCKQTLSEVILCNGNHIVCRQCGAQCEDCGKISCEFCLKQRCSVTKRRICRQCGAVCMRCKAFKNKRFMATDSAGRQLVCRNCS